jgi:four helix bundle protein
MQEVERTSAKSFRDLIVWQKAHQLVLDVYRCTQNFPREEVYALTSQLRRSATSVAANIAEGFKKKSPADKVRIFNIAQGSLSETEYYLILASDLQYDDMMKFMDRAHEVGKLLEAYMGSIRKSTKY